MSTNANRKFKAHDMNQAPTELSEEALAALENIPPVSPRAGQPRLSSGDTTIYNFYERLVLFERLQRTLGRLKLAPSSVPEPSEQPQPWRDFLNQLSWLCDCDNGGDTTSAIAVETTTTGPKYWLAENFDPRQKGPLHLTSVLEKLSELKASPAGTHRAISDEVLQACLMFSSEKFENYRRLLLKAIAFARRSLGDASDSLETRLLLGLESVSEHQEPLELSVFSYQYVRSDNVRQVHAKYRDKAPREAGSAWYNICHYVGRLGAWVRAINVVFCFVRDHPKVLENFRVSFVEAPGVTKPLAADHKTNLHSVLERMLPNDAHRAEQVLKLMRNATAAGFDLDKAFTRDYDSKTFSTRSHAELLLLQHFLMEKLAFFDNDKFVGSSKPSCYCCSLYFRLHEGNVVTRPSHGNVWSKWCLPAGLMQEDEGRLTWDGKTIVKRMTKQLRTDVLELVESGLPRRARLKDSTTGLWTAPTF